MDIDITVPQKVNAKTLSLCLKVSDSFTASLISDKGDVLKEHDGYVPSFMPGEHYGDYVMLEIDIDTGMITNWKKPSPEQIKEWVEEK